MDYLKAYHQRGTPCNAFEEPIDRGIACGKDAFLLVMIQVVSVKFILVTSVGLRMHQDGVRAFHPFKFLITMTSR
jgi:hypothetical protein